MPTGEYHNDECHSNNHDDHSEDVHDDHDIDINHDDVSQTDDDNDHVGQSGMSANEKRRVATGALPMKNEHIIWAYAERTDGAGQVLIIGVTDLGLAHLKAGEGASKQTLVIHPPGKGFANVTQVVVFHEKDKAALKAKLRESGMVVSEVN